MDKHIFVEHSRCSLDKEELLARMVEAIHIPDAMDNQHWVYSQVFAEDSLQRAHNLEQAVGRCDLEAGNFVADIQDKVGMVDKQDEKEALPRGAKPMSQKRVRDRSFGDQHVYLAQYSWQDVEASQWEYHLPPVF